MSTNAPKASSRNIFLKILIFFGFLLWAIAPTTLIVGLLGLNIQVNWPWYIQLLSVILWAIFTAFSIFFIWKYYKKISNDPTEKFKSRYVGYVILIYLVLRVAVTVCTLLMTWLEGQSLSANDQAIQNALSLSPSIIYTIAFYIAIAIVAPIVEELVFRGLFTHLFFNGSKSWLNATISSLLFGAMHASNNIISFIMYVLLGFGMFYAYKLRGNIKDAILLHLINNGIAVIMLIILQILYQLAPQLFNSLM